MIIDFEESQAPEDYKTTICVIGSGPIGLSFVSRFLGVGISILIVESGGFKDRSENEDLNRIVTTGDVVSGGPDSRARVFGGTSTMWGGQAIPLSPIDFRKRSWVPDSGWPISYDEVARYFDDASALLKLDNVGFDTDVWQKRIIKKNDIEDENLSLKFSKWSPFPDFSKKYNKVLSKSSDIHVLVNATVQRLELAEGGKSIDSATLVNRSGRRGRVRADLFVLCAGGIENPRILLCSNNRQQEGIGNQYGNVGRYYQDHAGYYGARLQPRDWRRFVDLFAWRFRGDVMYLPKLQLSNGRQQRTQSLNIVGNTGFHHFNESTIALKRVFNDIKSVKIDGQTLRNAIRSMSNPLETIQLVATYGLMRRQYLPKDVNYFLIANCETEPDRQSAVSLSDEVDRMGMPMASVNWKFGAQVKHTLRTYNEHIGETLKRLDVADAVIKQSLFEEGDDWKERVYSLYHHIGSTRMSDDPKKGVVDKHCRVFGVDNLFISGCSVFPTGGAANPTFTAMALSLRLADHIQAQM